MKTTILTIAMMILGSNAFADGFVCDNADGNLRMKVYHQTQPELGTRNVAVMIVSDPTIGEGKKTIARFTADHAVLGSKSAVYTAKEDLRFNDSNLAGKNIGGTKLGNVDELVLNVDYSFNNPVADGTQVAGELIISRRSGSDISVPMTCTRYLKGE